jgi:tetratricopeptide (TPR) repeat protein
MRRFMAVIGTLLVLVPGVAAAQAPPAPSPARERAREDLAKADPELRRHAVARLGEAGTMDDAPALVQALRNSDRVVRALAERALWRVWSRSGDAEVDALLARGIEQMGEGAAEAAIGTFSGIIARKPDFAEGWNKRATLYFLIGEYDKSLKDCDEVVKRNPAHFGALSGYGQIYLRLGQPDKALPYFERALAVNPNLDQVAVVVRELREAASRRRRDSI